MKKNMDARAVRLTTQDYAGALESGLIKAPMKFVDIVEGVGQGETIVAINMAKRRIRASAAEGEANWVFDVRYASNNVDVGITRAVIKGEMIIYGAAYKPKSD